MIRYKFKYIFSDDELNRLIIQEQPKKGIRIRADVHGMKCIQARRFINNIINIARCSFQLTIIHGFNHGKAIKDMLANDFCNHYVTAHFSDSRNQGITYMFITV